MAKAGTMMDRSWIGRMSLALVIVMCLGGEAGAQDQPPPGNPLTGENTSLEELDKLAQQLESRKKEADQPRFEMFRSQVLPLDVIPLMKPNHWATMAFEIRANKEDYRGELRTAAEAGGQPQVLLLDIPQAMVYRRGALLPKKQTVLRELNVFLPGFNRNTNRLLIELAPEAGARFEVGFEAIVQRMEPHQMLVPVLSRDPSALNSWSKSSATLPASAEGNAQALDRQLYYRLLFPLRPEEPPLPAHPLCWTTTSHIIWQNFSPESLSRGGFSQQQAMVDWLHWGGQLIILATGPSLAALEDSELGPFLPARYSGQSEPMTPGEMESLSKSYPPAFWSGDLLTYVTPESNMAAVPPPRNHPPEPLQPIGDRIPRLSRLDPVASSDVSVVPLGGPDGRALAVERRVGRGRVTMLAIDPTDPTLTKWSGLDGLIRRVVFRRPVEEWIFSGGQGFYRPLSGPDVSWLRYTARDLGAGAAENEVNPDDSNSRGDLPFSPAPVAAWIDTTPTLPTATRDTLERSSGIVIPDNRFVLKVILLYVVALVPVNWLICRYLLRRRELAWVVAPILALGFAYGVERMAAVDVGFESSIDEIDLVELQGAYPRAHVSRFGSVYTSGRVEYRLSTPGNPTTLILPMRAYRGLRGEQVRLSDFDSTAEPTLGGYLVQPRSLAMFRSESMIDLGGGLVLEGDAETGRLLNGTDLELLDATLVDVDRNVSRSLGRIGPWPGATGDGPGDHVVDLRERTGEQTQAPGPDEAWAAVPEYLKRLREYVWSGPQERGEYRLVAWARGPQPGLEVTPSVDRRRGVRLVVAHLRFGMPAPDLAAYVQGSPARSELPVEGEARVQ